MHVLDVLRHVLLIILPLFAVWVVVVRAPVVIVAVVFVGFVQRNLICLLLVGHFSFQLRFAFSFRLFDLATE